MKKKKAVVLLSGGIDSVVVTAILKNEGYELYALTFDYGQRNGGELIAARACAEELGVKAHKEIRISGISTESALTNESREVPQNRSVKRNRKWCSTNICPRQKHYFFFLMRWDTPKV